MTVWVRCSECGVEHPSRFRASTRDQFTWLDPFVGSVLEPCPGCGASPLLGPPQREWRDAPRMPMRVVGRRSRSSRRFPGGA